MEILIPQPSKEYENYYIIPDFSYAVIKTDGSLKSSRTGKKVSTFLHPCGYIKLSVWSGDKIINGFLHRLLARTFIGRPNRHLDKDYSLLEVNHIDCNKTNNDLSNLEWVTPKENIHHALANGMMKGNNVLLKHLLNGSIGVIPSVIECSKLLNISLTRLSRHLKSPRAGTITKNWFVFKYDDGKEWPVLNEKQIQKNSWDVMYGIWYAKDLTNNKVYINNTLEGLCNVLQLNYNTVQRIRAKENTHIDNFLIWYDDAPKEDVIKSLPDRKTAVEIRKPMPVKFTSTIDNNILEFDSMVKAAKHFNVGSKCIAYAINKKDGKFKDYIVENV